MNNSAYEARVRQLEAEGMTRSDAQSVADVEVMRQPELLLYGVRDGAEDWEEELLLTRATKATIEQVKIVAAKDGFGRFRVSTYNGEKPDFLRALEHFEGTP